MMKYLTAFVLLGFLSCKTKNSKSLTAADSAANQKLFIPSYTVNNFEGTYTGNFDNGYITIFISLQMDALI